MEMHIEDQELKIIVSLFFEENIFVSEIKNTSHGENDFRETVILRTESGNKFVIKLADNDFTFAEKIKMWQR